MAAAKRKRSDTFEVALRKAGNLKVTGQNKQALLELGLDEKDCTYNMMLAISAYENAVEGNSKYLDLIMSAKGSKASDKLAKKKVEIQQASSKDDGTDGYL